MGSLFVRNFCYDEADNAEQMKERSAGAVLNLEEKPGLIVRKKQSDEVAEAVMLECGSGL